MTIGFSALRKIRPRVFGFSRAALLQVQEPAAQEGRADILKRSPASSGREEPHPFGWDDLCV